MQNNNLKINASPTKDLFITMLVRDLTLRDAIGDLVDNSVDGAKRLRPDEKYSGLKINIEAYSDHFSINDNCGGIESNVAREYAFRFGRPKGQGYSPGSVGQFGIGMKRSLFKLGKLFKIDSSAPTSSFKVEVDVNEWQEKGSSDWAFEFTELNEGESNGEFWTKIYVTNLNSDIKEQFEDSNFLKKLIREIELEHLYNIDKGLTIIINGVKLKSRSLSLLESDDFRSARFEHTYDDGMSIKLIAGIGEAKLEDGGWYIFCNNRLIVGPEQTELSGWTGKRGTDGVANYHGQFQMFRGYAFLNADDSSILPWNTTKNGMDRDSPRFKNVRQRMIETMKPIITFLNHMKKEREGKSTEDSRPLEKKVKEASLKTISEYSDNRYSTVFSHPVPQPVIKKPDTDNKIIYLMAKDKVNEVKKLTKLKKLSDIGEYTFNYYYDMEIED